MVSNGLKLSFFFFLSEGFLTASYFSTDPRTRSSLTDWPFVTKRTDQSLDFRVLSAIVLHPVLFELMGTSRVTGNGG